LDAVAFFMRCAIPFPPNVRYRFLVAPPQPTGAYILSKAPGACTFTLLTPVASGSFNRYTIGTCAGTPTVHTITHFKLNLGVGVDGGDASYLLTGEYIVDPPVGDVLNIYVAEPGCSYNPDICDDLLGTGLLSCWTRFGTGMTAVITEL
tara:strand:- start:923 stop:1369 length:447 start_codon:yes stop_codon:yes gene_type:complete